MKKIIFIRHVQSVANVGAISVAHYAIPPYDLGQMQAEALSKLQPDQLCLILTSSSLCVQQTAVTNRAKSCAIKIPKAKITACMAVIQESVHI